MGKEFDTLFFLVYLIIGGYFINRAISYMALPKIVTEYDQWIMLIGGILIVIGGISHLRISSRKKRDRAYKYGHR